jgi:hypothetical protein
MSKETPNEYQPRPYEIFGITEEEVSRWRISDKKLNEILASPNTTVNTIKTDSNNYGEFLFLTASRGIGKERICMTFWGLGFHRYRERWITQEWFWYQTSTSFVDSKEELTREEAQERLKNRRKDISYYKKDHEQSKLGRLFELLADLMDDDAALAEMQDLGFI